MSTYDFPTVYISMFWDIILSPLVQELPSFVMDTPQFLQIISDFEFPANSNHERLLFTTDVHSLYIFIPHDGALETCKHFFDKRNNKSISTSTPLQLIEVVHKMNTFHFNDRYLFKELDVAMGTTMGPSVACLFMEHSEE